MNQLVGRAADVAADVTDAVARRLRSVARRHGALSGWTHEEARRWLVVTINRPPEEVALQGRLPSPLSDLAGSLEVEVRPAPGDRGTELAVRPRQLVDDAEHPLPSRDDVRLALRQTKQLVETGELLAVEPQPEGRRSPTLTDLALEAATWRARRKGRL
jgi:hypothetical protein